MSHFVLVAQNFLTIEGENVHLVPYNLWVLDFNDLTYWEYVLFKRFSSLLYSLLNKLPAKLFGKIIQVILLRFTPFYYLFQIVFLSNYEKINSYFGEDYKPTTVIIDSLIIRSTILIKKHVN
jgi:hypothetical protein